MYREKQLIVTQLRVFMKGMAGALSVTVKT